MEDNKEENKMKGLNAKLVGRHVVVRAEKAGVHAGIFVCREDGLLYLKNSRRLWSWWSKFTLSGLVTCGVLESKRDQVNFSCVLDEQYIRDSDVYEILPTTAEAQKSIESIPEHINV